MESEIISPESPASEEYGSTINQLYKYQLIKEMNVKLSFLIFKNC